MSTRYYLNNMTEKDLTINLSITRLVKPMSSLPLNDKDLAIYKKLKAARRGKASLLDGLVLSTIPVEKDSRYAQAKAVAEGGTKQLTPEELAKLEQEAKEKAEAEAKARELAEKEAKEKAEKEAKLKEQLRKEIEQQAKKDKRTFAEGQLEKEVEEAFAKLQQEQQG